ncbi:hypothetical protein JTB14_002086 [Gonioctena quinquepunctata]|nr:hypothetical protein JTB14_002086 [Gonioctena quinquepunctata]
MERQPIRLLRIEFLRTMRQYREEDRPIIHGHVVIDNAPYHNKQLETSPTSSSRKAEMQELFRDRGIPCDNKMLKAQFHSLIKIHKPRHKRYEIDDDVLPLPP